MHTISILVMFSMLSPKINIKNAIYRALFSGESPQIEAYLKIIKGTIRIKLEELNKKVKIL